MKGAGRILYIWSESEYLWAKAWSEPSIARAALSMDDYESAVCEGELRIDGTCATIGRYVLEAVFGIASPRAKRYIQKD